MIDMATGRIGKYIGSALAGAAALGMSAAADASLIDIDWRLNPNYDNVSYLIDKDTLDPLVSGSNKWEYPYGGVSFSNGDDVPKGWKLILMDSGNQPVGIQTITTNGVYSAAVYGDKTSTTNIDEGIPMNTQVGVIAQSPENRFYAASISPAYTFADLEDPVNRDIIVTSTELPEPATLTLLGIGAGVAALTRRRRKRKDMESDIGKPQEPYYRRFE
jgi:hypothetical protein